jgi:hypothetical protein
VTLEPWADPERRNLDYSDEVAHEVVRDYFERQRSGSTVWTAHATLTTLKVAAVMALMEGYAEVSWDDFTLAREVVAKSIRVLRWAESEVHALAQKKTRASGTAQGYRELAKNEVLEQDSWRRAREQVLHTLRGGRGRKVTWSVLRDRCARHSEILGEVLQEMETKGDVCREDYTYQGRRAHRYWLP